MSSMLHYFVHFIQSQKPGFININEDRLANLLENEKRKLKVLSIEFMGDHLLLNLQQKLISALKDLLELINKPNAISRDIHALMGKVKSLSLEVNHEISSADRNQRHDHEQQLSENKNSVKGNMAENVLDFSNEDRDENENRNIMRPRLTPKF